jgi:prevent-host-death family protein
MDTGEITINATEFKAKCLDLLDQVSARKITRLIVTKRGVPVAVLIPPDTVGAAESLFGAMRSSVVVPGGVDLTAPAFEGTPEAADRILY